MLKRGKTRRGFFAESEDDSEERGFKRGMHVHAADSEVPGVMSAAQLEAARKEMLFKYGKSSAV